VKKGTIVATLLVATGVLAGLLGYLLLDDGPGSGSGTAGKNPAPGGKGGAGDGFRDADFAGQGAGGAGAGLTPEQEKMLRAALERIGNEAAIRAALTSDVPEPWPLPESQNRFATCLIAIEGSLSADRAPAKEQICACATRAIQRTYPKAPPRAERRHEIKSAGANFRAAVEECTNGP